MNWISKTAAKSLISLGFQDWVNQLDCTVAGALKQYDIQVVAPIYGGLTGAILHVKLYEEDLILKLMPTELVFGQVAALEAIAGEYAPLLYTADLNQGTLLMQYIFGSPGSTQKPFNLAAASQRLAVFQSNSLNLYQQTHEEHVSQWLLSKTGSLKTPRELNRLIKWAFWMIETAPTATLQHVHGDLGIHNFIVDTTGEFWVIDPSGISGPAEYDAGCLAACSGFPKRYLPQQVITVANLLGLNSREVARWAVIRVIAAASLGLSRGDPKLYKESLAAASLFAKKFELIFPQAPQNFYQDPDGQLAESF